MRRLALAAVLALGGCDLAREPYAGHDASLGPDGWPLPATDLVPAVGGPDTLDVATWNIEHFPKSDDAIALAADVIASLDLDVVVAQEIESVAAWDELVARLPEHAGVLSSRYQKIGVLYREPLIAASDGELLFVTDSWEFPRPPLRVQLTVGGATIDLVGLHLKAGVGSDDRQRRADAVAILDAWVRQQVDAGAEDELLLVGDYNASLDPERPDLDEVWPPLLGAPDRYAVRTVEVAARGEVSFIPAGTILDHVVTTAGLDDEVGDRDAVIPDLAPWIASYEDRLSDHLPVVLSFPNP
jgi:endonuclease/exonuclease/phosphatase family metal-dependent hydrolase